MSADRDWAFARARQMIKAGVSKATVVAELVRAGVVRDPSVRSCEWKHLLVRHRYSEVPVVTYEAGLRAGIVVLIPKLVGMTPLLIGYAYHRPPWTCLGDEAALDGVARTYLGDVELSSNAYAVGVEFDESVPWSVLVAFAWKA